MTLHDIKISSNTTSNGKLSKPLCNLDRTEQNRTEQNRTEQNRTEQNRTEQNRTEQNRAEQSRAEQSRTEQNRTDIQPCIIVAHAHTHAQLTQMSINFDS